MAEDARQRFQDEVVAGMVAAQNKHALRVGQATLAWIHFHVYFRLWFSTLTAKGENHAPAMREWDLIPSDSIQRKQKLQPALETLRARSAEAADAVQWAASWADQLAIIRNAFVHSVVFFQRLPNEISVQFDEQLHLSDEEDRFRMVKKMPDASFEALMTDLANLSEFLHRTFNAFVLPDKFGPLPHRPEIATAKLFPDLAKKVEG